MVGRWLVNQVIFSNSEQSHPIAWDMWFYILFLSMESLRGWIKVDGYKKFSCYQRKKVSILSSILIKVAFLGYIHSDQWVPGLMVLLEVSESYLHLQSPEKEGKQSSTTMTIYHHQNVLIISSLCFWERCYSGAIFEYVWSLQGFSSKKILGAWRLLMITVVHRLIHKAECLHMWQVEKGICKMWTS